MLKQWNFKIVLIIVLILLGNKAETLSQVLQNSDSAKDKRFLPDYKKLQLAGVIGFISMGVGYTFF